MRTNEVDILMVPGWGNSGPDHWQTRWQSRLKTASRVRMPDFDRPVCRDWVTAIAAAVAATKRPTVLIAHSCGILAVVHAAPLLEPGKVVGAFLVGPVDLTVRAPLEALIESQVAADGGALAAPVGFEPMPIEPLPFPSLLVASRNDAYCSLEAAGEMALAWGAELVDAGEVGHINTESGHGPWPEGALRFGSFLRQLTPDSGRPTIS